jgi:glycosyltransferase involved in cell wall biosynthesis
LKVLFLTLLTTKDINDRGLYNDLLRTFVKHNHEVFVVSPIERRNKKPTQLIKTNNATIINVKTLNIQKTNIIEKGIGSLLLEYQYLKAIKKYFSDVKFDLVLYSTPPITFSKIVNYIKKRDSAFAYLLLKDIFPQNAVDLGFIKKNGIIYNFFRKKEKELYNISDKIGCMSPANVKYVIEHNSYIPLHKVEVCPNSIEPITIEQNSSEKVFIKNKYGVPNDKIIFVYGGNLGKPQGIDFLTKVLDANKTNHNHYFLIIGDGTEYDKLEKWFQENKPTNAQLRRILPKTDYDKLLRACDVGMLFLDERFTIPNFPSRILSYMENGMPVLAATDENTDIGQIMENNRFGLWSKVGDLNSYNKNLDTLKDKALIKTLGQNANIFLLKEYTTKISYQIIMLNLKKKYDEN